MNRLAQLQMAMIALVAVLVYFGLTPFSFRPANRVTWLPATVGLAFEGKGQIYSEGPLRWSSPSGGALSIHLLLESRQDGARGLGALLSLDDGAFPPPLLIAQWRDGLIMRTRQTGEPRGRGYWEIGAQGVLGAFESRLVSIVSNSEDGTKIFVDGELRQKSTRSIVEHDAVFGGRLLFGSLRDGRASWSGALRGLSLYEGALSDSEVAADATRILGQGFAALARHSGELAFYAFDERNADFVADRSRPSRAGSLLIPIVFAPVAPSIFEWPERGVHRKAWFFRDGLRNLLGFAPLGLLVVLVGRERGGRSKLKSVGAALAIGSALSLSIEAIQVLLPMRNSSLLDLALNISGTGLGAVLALSLVRVLSSSRVRGPTD